jgi:hypothetical protein
MYNHLNPIKVATKLVTTEKNIIFIFGQIVSINDVILSTLKNEL